MSTRHEISQAWINGNRKDAYEMALNVSKGDVYSPKYRLYLLLNLRVAFPSDKIYREFVDYCYARWDEDTE